MFLSRANCLPSLIKTSYKINISVRSRVLQIAATKPDHLEQVCQIVRQTEVIVIHCTHGRGEMLVLKDAVIRMVLKAAPNRSIHLLDLRKVSILTDKDLVQEKPHPAMPITNPTPGYKMLCSAITPNAHATTVPNNERHTWPAPRSGLTSLRTQ